MSSTPTHNVPAPVIAARERLRKTHEALTDAAYLVHRAMHDLRGEVQRLEHMHPPPGKEEDDCLRLADELDAIVKLVEWADTAIGLVADRAKVTMATITLRRSL